jgi:hypothetical protein
MALSNLAKGLSAALDANGSASAGPLKWVDGSAYHV